jgi:hypothetical protein
MRILIVEDEGHLARLVAEVLGREGYAAEAVGDGRTALARALVEPFDPKPEPFETGTGAWMLERMRWRLTLGYAGVRGSSVCLVPEDNLAQRRRVPARLGFGARLFA